jgi:plastocyanin
MLGDNRSIALPQLGGLAMRSHGIGVPFGVAFTDVVLACSSSSNTTGPTGGHSATIVASSTTTGGSYGGGGNYFFNPTPDTVAAGTTVNFQFGSVVHNVHFLSGPTTPDSIPVRRTIPSPAPLPPQERTTTSALSITSAGFWSHSNVDGPRRSL